MVEFYTIQISQRRKCPPDVEMIDTTVKSGRSEFAPTWHMVLGYKKGALSEDDYRQLFLEQMRKSLTRNRALWMAVLSKPKVALACYCPPGAFCHRLILVELFQKLADLQGIDFLYGGEVGTRKDSPGASGGAPDGRSKDSGSIAG